VRRGTPFAVALALALVLAGTASGFGVKYASGPDPAVSRWPSWPYPTGCLGVGFDPVTVFGGATGAENGSGGPELALRKYLDEGLYPQVPSRYWRPVATSEGRASFSSGRLEQGLFWLTAVEVVPGQWSVAGAPEECRARSLRDGEAAIDWTLHDRESLGPGSRRIAVDLHSGRGCDGGRSHNEAAEPRFSQLGGKLVLTIWLDPLSPGTYNCKARSEGPLTLRLSRPLGGRQLWDGGSFPPNRED
jgi:hypothetical protein